MRTHSTSCSPVCRESSRVHVFYRALSARCTRYMLALLMYYYMRPHVKTTSEHQDCLRLGKLTYPSPPPPYNTHVQYKGIGGLLGFVWDSARQQPPATMCVLPLSPSCTVRRSDALPCLFDWLVGWLVCLVGLVGWLVGCLVGWLVVRLVGWLVGLFGWLVFRLVGWLFCLVG